MSFLKSKILPSWRRIKGSLPEISGRKTTEQAEMDKKLVYSLSPRKIPNSKQLKHLRKFLNPKELVTLKVASLVFLFSLAGLIFYFVRNNISYLPAEGGVYIEGVVGYPKTDNPIYAVNRDIDNDLNRLVYSSLFRYGKDGKLQNDLAESYSISEDGKEYIIKIKSGVKWHDGSDFSVDDIVFTYNLIKNPDYRSPLRNALSVAEIEKVDDTSVKFVLSEAYAPFLELLSFGILPANLWENVSPDSIILSELNLKAIGSGIFKFKSITKNKSGEIKEFILERNNDYYGKKAYLDGIKFVFFADRQEAIKALNDKHIMGINYLPFSAQKDLLAKNSLNINDLVQPQVVSLFFNSTKNSVLGEKDTRLALAQAINKQEIVDDVFGGSYRIADGPYIKENPAYDEEMFRVAHDREKASRILKDKNLSLNLTVVDAGNNYLVAERIKENLASAGVNLEIKMVSGEQAANLIKDRDFEILLYGQAVGGDPDIYAFWHSGQIGAKGLNLAAYNNSEVDKLLLEARSAVDAGTRINKYKEIQKILLSEVPVIFLYFPNYTYVLSREVRGFSGTVLIEPASRFSDVADWYLKTKKILSW